VEFLGVTEVVGLAVMVCMGGKTDMRSAVAAVSEDLVPPVTELGATPNLIEAAEERARKCSIRFERAENDRDRLGHEFGEALVALRSMATYGDWDDYLDRLGISRDKARYWMAKAAGKRTDRHAKKPDAGKSDSMSVQEMPALRCPLFSWASLRTSFLQLADDAAILANSQPQGSDVLIEPLRHLADTLGFKLEPREGTDA
jgi:hypothetical protein